MPKIKKRWWIVAILSCLFLILDIALFIGIKHYFPDAWEKEKQGSSIVSKENKQQTIIKDSLKNIRLNSEYAMLVDLEDQQVLYEKNSKERIYPASLTKVLTAIAALDATDDLAKKAEVTAEDLQGLWEENASVAGFQAGDQISYEDALYALMLPSGADAANFLANRLSGSVPAFVDDMNKKAQAFGMKNTHFMNTSGLHDDNHYTTLSDMKIMMDHAWKNTAFRKVMTSLQYTIPSIGSHPDGLALRSTLLMFRNDLSFRGGEIIGGKSGFTLEAGSNLISIAKMSDGHMYMLLTAKASGEPLTDQNHMKDAQMVYTTIANAKE